MFKVMSKRCTNCLMSKNKIVSDERKQDLLNDIEKDSSFFVCHHADGTNICCKGFFDSKHADNSQLIQIAKRLNLVEFVPLEEKVKYTAYRLQKIIIVIAVILLSSYHYL